MPSLSTDFLENLKERNEPKMGGGRDREIRVGLVRAHLYNRFCVKYSYMEYNFKVQFFTIYSLFLRIYHCLFIQLSIVLAGWHTT